MMNEKTTSAPAGVSGHDYQVDLSIYLVLDLMLVRKRLDAITLELANHDHLDLPKDHPHLAEHGPHQQHAFVIDDLHRHRPRPA